MAYERKRPPLDPCPVETVVAIVGGKWKARILLELTLGPATFSELRRALPRVTQQVLSTQLRGLVADAVVSRRRAGRGMADGSIYTLTALGRSLVAALEAVAAWGEARLRDRGHVWQRPTLRARTG